MASKKKARKSASKVRQHPRHSKPAASQGRHQLGNKTSEQPKAAPLPGTEEPTEVLPPEEAVPSNITLCENCQQPIDMEMAEALICPECGGLGSDQCCMDSGEGEPCKLCRQERGEEEEDEDGEDDGLEDSDDDDGYD